MLKASLSGKPLFFEKIKICSTARMSVYSVLTIAVRPKKSNNSDKAKTGTVSSMETTERSVFLSHPVLTPLLGQGNLKRQNAEFVKQLVCRT